MINWFSPNQLLTYNCIVNLSQPWSDFERLDIRISQSGQEFRTWYPNLSNYIDLKTINLVNDATDTTLMAGELRLQQESSTSLKIVHNMYWGWTGNQANSAIKSVDSTSGIRIYNIIGYR